MLVCLFELTRDELKRAQQASVVNSGDARNPSEASDDQDTPPPSVEASNPGAQPSKEE